MDAGRPLAAPLRLRPPDLPKQAARPLDSHWSPRVVFQWAPADELAGRLGGHLDQTYYARGNVGIAREGGI